MKSSCVFLLVLAVFGVLADAYVGSVYPSGCCSSICKGGYGMGYGAGYGGMYGGGCGAAICDTCQCVKTVVRPPCVERIPYCCSRRVQPSTCGTGCGVYPAAAVGIYTGPASGLINGGYSGYGNGFAANIL